MSKPSVPVTRPLLPPLEEFIPLLQEIWACHQLTNAGPMHERLETELARYLGVPHISLVANGTLALLTALEALEVRGDVITTPYTFVATTHVLRRKGLRPVFADVDPQTLNLDPCRIEEAITPATTAILAVHCYGQPCDVEAIEAIARRHGLRVIYDAAHAFGVRDASDGSVLRHGDLACLSFHATKVFNTFEGGAIVSPDAATKQRIDRLRNFGFVDEVTVNEVGINAKMSEVHAAFGLLQLRHVDAALAARARIAAIYREGLAGVKGIRCLSNGEGPPSNHGYFPILVGPQYPLGREALYQQLREHGVHARRYFYPLASSFPMYADLPSAAAANLPVAHQAASEVLCLPIYPALDDDTVTRVLTLVAAPSRPATAEAPAQTPGPSRFKVTVAIPAYKARFLDAALRSALDQDFDNFEILVCDDCRTGEVARVVAPYLLARNGPPVRYVFNETQLYEPGNFARCVELAHGDYVRLLCDDDLLLPGTLAAQADVLDAHPGVSLVSSRRTLIDELGNPLAAKGPWCSPFEGDVLVQGPDLVSFLADCTLNFIGEPSCAMFRRAQMLPLGNRLMQLGGQPIQWLGDLTMHANLLRQGDLAMLEAPGARFRISSEQVSHMGRTVPGAHDEAHATFRRMLHELGWQRSANNHLVRIAPLATPQQMGEIDLLARVNRMVRGDDPVNPLRRWLAERTPSPAQARLTHAHLATQPQLPHIAIFVCNAGGDADRLAATLDSLAPGQCLYPHTQVNLLGKAAPTPRAGMRYIPADDSDWLAILNQEASVSEWDWVLLIRAGETFTQAGLQTVALELLDASGCRAVCTDEIVRAEDGTLDPVFRPDFNLDMLLSCPANMARHWLFRRDVFLEAGGFDAAYAQAPEFALLLRLIETGGLDGLAHVHEPLLTIAAPPMENNAHELAVLQQHLLARGYDNATVDAALPGRYRILYGHQAQPLVSIIIPTRDQFALLERCVSSLLEKTTYPHYEILLVDNGSTDPAACAWLDGLAALGEARIRVLRYPEEFNYAAMNNLGAREARGDYLVLLNNDTAIVQGDWLDALLNHAQRPEVGVVGAKLLYPSGQVQHAGLLLGLHGMAGYPFSGAEADAPGYMHRLEIDQNYSAVSAACLMVRRALYDELGGMDAEAFPLICGDMDLCLRARAAGYLTVWTPHAVLLHEKGATLPAVPPEAFAQQRERAQDAMYRRWLPALAHDPAYNRNLSLQSTEFAVETDTRLNWNPLPWRPLPVVLAVNADAFGCGHYRIIHPGQAMAQAGLADVRVSEYQYGPVEMERLRPDTWVLQRLVSDAPFEMVRRTAPFTQAFKVAELDDYLLNLPMKNGHRGQLPQDMQRVLRRWLDLTDRLVVSTAPLAEAMAKLHRDIRVVPNRLPPERWGRIASLRSQGRRPRVGWAGGASHQGDLELIADVVKALAGEVEWVFLGMCPAPMRPYLHEHHAPVDIASYPHKLASLNLDLAVAPLEHNLFNDCKSNLKLLEYGACGYPVVCSDVAAYQGSLPVTRVKNRYKDWVDAIRMHLADLDATAAAGDALRDAIRRDWMLEGAHLDDWLRAWLPG